MIRKNAVSLILTAILALSIVIALPITNSTAADHHSRVVHADNFPTPTPTDEASTNSNPSAGGNGGG
jgi:hypothetical protein